jgi:hypothetical protein
MDNLSTRPGNEAERIRALNDRFRKTLMGGRVVVTRGIAGRSDIKAILEAVRAFDNFTEAKDPYQEHDFGAFEAGIDTVFWKIDYYSIDLNYGSPDPTDCSVTTRVLTVMLASDY